MICRTRLVIGQASQDDGATNNSFKCRFQLQSKAKQAPATTLKAKAKAEALWDRISCLLKLEMLQETLEELKEITYSSSRCFQQHPN